MDRLDRIVLIRIGEIYLKGKNRNYFEGLLIANIKKKLDGINCKMYFGRNRYVISDFSEVDETKIVDKIRVVFGIHSLSVGFKTNANLNSIFDVIQKIAPSKGSFKIVTNRADKRFELNSIEINRELGGRLLEKLPKLSVDLHNPESIINVDIREDGFAYVFSGRVMGAGGMPIGCSGRGLLLLSGGIDSPVAGYMMAKRGISINALHFHSYPYTSENAREKVIKLAKIMEERCGEIKLSLINAAPFQEAVNKYCDNSYLITLLRRFMVRVAERVAKKLNCGCIINGESLGQVASQTLQSISVTNIVSKDLPILRPLIGFDKFEITEIAEKIGTYETSILPFEDCCTVFLPQNPATKPSLKKCECEEEKIPNYDELLENAIKDIEVL